MARRDVSAAWRSLHDGQTRTKAAIAAGMKSGNVNVAAHSRQTRPDVADGEQSWRTGVVVIFRSPPSDPGVRMLVVAVGVGLTAGFARIAIR